MTVEKCCMVFLNDEPTTVRVRTESEQETLEALGLEPSERVAFDYAQDRPLDFTSGWTFVDGQRYVTVDILAGLPCEQSDPNETAPWATDPDAWGPPSADWWRDQ